MSQTSQKRRNGKAPCLGGKQETIIQHIEIVKQRGQAECLTPLFLPIFDSLSGKFGREDLFFSPASLRIDQKALYSPNAHIEQSGLDIRLGGSRKPPASPSLFARCS